MVERKFEGVELRGPQEMRAGKGGCSNCSVTKLGIRVGKFLELLRERGGDLTLVYLPSCAGSKPISCEQWNEEIETQNRRVSCKTKRPVINKNNHRSMINILVV